MIRYLTRKNSLRDATYVCLFFGGMFIYESSGEALWKVQNPGKSFEEAKESVEKSKSQKDKPHV